MSVVVAVPDSPEGTAALAAAADEATLLNTNVVIVNLGLRPLDASMLPTGVETTVIDRIGIEQRDPLDVVLHEIDQHDTQRLVIGVRRRSAVGKALLGSLSQRLILNAPVPVVAVKVAEED
ncbi:universal stress protein [Rhodococcus sp. T2V]|uniref:universal stress protein n=1 Tax=Rhodococcus sp. T2V TaxID=3034164 RepID=UPI0023E2D604|nr:universal stress protein [Rhodococcus sp. T2V]MDF3307201.1 universal stress protein [Rhodococcus sp. T2V]